MRCSVVKSPPVIFRENYDKNMMTNALFSRNVYFEAITYYSLINFSNYYNRQLPHAYTYSEKHNVAECFAILLLCAMVGYMFR